MMTLRLYDTYTRSLRDFQPLHAPEVGAILPEDIWQLVHHARPKESV